MTYPLVTQTVITNGKLWSFYVYQLNTTLLHAEHTSNNPRHNLCWGTPELKLFETIEDGKVIGKQLKLTYLLTQWCRVLLEKLTGLQLFKKFPAFHGTRRFITALTSVRHLSLSWARPIQSIYPHPTSWRSILILSTHLGLGLPSGVFPSGFPTKTLYTPHSSPTRATCPAHLFGPSV